MAVLFRKGLFANLVFFFIFGTALFYFHRYEFDFTCQDIGFKIMGARLQMQHTNVFFYTMPNNNTVVNGIVSTPLLNSLHTPLIGLGACKIKSASFFINFFFLFWCLFFAARLIANVYLPRFCVLAGSIVFFLLFARPFFYNLLTGQIYLLFTTMFFLLFYLLQKKHYFLFGFVWFLAIAVRPLFSAGIILVFLYRNKKIAAGLLTGLMFVLLFTLITHTFYSWEEYSGAMKKYAYQIPGNWAAGTAAFPIPPIITPLSFSDCKGIFPDATQLGKIMACKPGIELPPLQFFLVTKFNVIITNTAFYASIAGLLSLLLVTGLRMRFREISAEKYVLAVFILYLICELCAPAPRGSYSFVLWLFALSLIIAKANTIEILCMTTGLVWANQLLYFKYPIFGELVMVLACIMFLFRKNQNPYYVNWFGNLKSIKFFRQWFALIQ